MTDALGDLLRAAVRVEQLFRNHGWGYCLIGGVAVQRWGNPRFTRDIDVTLLTGFGDEASFLDRLLEELQPRFDNAREFALAHRVLLARTPSGVEVDVALGALPFEERTVDRSTLWTLRPDIALTTCSAEDLVVHKVFAGRETDWADVEGVLLRQHGKLDLGLIRSEAKPLLAMKDDSGALAKFETIRARVERRLRDSP